MKESAISSWKKRPRTPSTIAPRTVASPPSGNTLG
jgi:hypothetical protein